MRTIALLTEYDGTRFLGWQSQREGRTIQNELESALSVLFEQPIRLYGCSRTDAGVHAIGHVSHFKASGSIPSDRIPLALSAILPEDIAVRLAVEMPETFHARYGARAKRYTYRIWNTRIRSAITRQTVFHEPRPLDLGAMRQAALLLTGRHDFSAFMAAGGKTATTVRTLMDVRVDRIPGDPTIKITVTGDGFLYNMVRILSGTLLYAGLGKIRPEDLPEILLSGDRRRAGKTLPAKGLTLEAVYYEQDGRLATLSGDVLELAANGGESAPGGYEHGL
ncbi:MAG TPA: tRNA pseudouridine(38-40) synthase TruA [Clostridia bacterium]